VRRLVIATSAGARLDGPEGEVTTSSAPSAATDFPVKARVGVLDWGTSTAQKFEEPQLSRLLENKDMTMSNSANIPSADSPPSYTPLPSDRSRRAEIKKNFAKELYRANSQLENKVVKAAIFAKYGEGISDSILADAKRDLFKEEGILCRVSTKKTRRRADAKIFGDLRSGSKEEIDDTQHDPKQRVEVKQAKIVKPVVVVSDSSIETKIKNFFDQILEDYPGIKNLAVTVDTQGIPTIDISLHQKFSV
jgi:hypothetical protein